MQVLFHKARMTIFGIHAYITLMNWSQFCVTLGYNFYMMNCIRHNFLSPIQCLRAFPILFFAQLLFYCYCYNHYKTKNITFATVTTSIILLCYQILAADIKFPGVVELTTQLLILENIFWLPLRIFFGSPCVESTNLG